MLPYPSLPALYFRGLLLLFTRQVANYSLSILGHVQSLPRVWVVTTDGRAGKMVEKGRRVTFNSL